MTDLLPCPNCGAEAAHYYGEIYDAISCTKCPLEVSTRKISPKELETIWNNLPRRKTYVCDSAGKYIDQYICGSGPIDEAGWPFLHGLNCYRCSKTHEIEDLRAYICGLENGIFDLYKKLHLR